MQLIFTLVAVLGLAFATLYFIKRMMRSRATHQNQDCAIKVIEKRMLSPKASIYLIEVLGKGIVISESPSGIHLITALPEDLDMEQMMTAMRKEIKPAISLFPKKLKELLKTSIATKPPV